jgi:hypothetical protein
MTLVNHDVANVLCNALAVVVMVGSLTLAGVLVALVLLTTRLHDLWIRVEWMEDRLHAYRTSHKKPHISQEVLPAEKGHPASLAGSPPASAIDTVDLTP